MRVTSVHLKNFKRFTDLLIRDIPETAKLVVVVGPNGCGKSSLFDALLNWYRLRVGMGGVGDLPYFQRDASVPFDWFQNVDVKLAGNEVPRKGCLYIRSAYRNDPDFSTSAISRPDVPSETLRLNRFIDNDAVVSANYQRLVYETIAGVYDAQNDDKTVRDLRKELVGQIRDSMKAVFGDLVLNNIADPLGSGAFNFDKGSSKSYHYKNLSGGEKGAFDLLLDLHIKKKYFGNAIYCIDEIETHLHTRVQGLLLKEMVKVLPDGAQLWVTTHSLGVLRAAQDLDSAIPGQVSVVDFDSTDPDVPREIVPSSLGRVTWEKMLSIALDDLSQRVAPRVVIVCEGSSIGTHRKDFDAEIYNRIFGAQYTDILFVSGGASSQVAASGISIRNTLNEIIPPAKVVAMCDRDDKSDFDVETFERRGNLVLGLRNLESYLLADDVIEALVAKEGKRELLAAALTIKREAIAAAVGRGRPADDLKSAAGDIYVGLKQLLGLQRRGHNSDSFLRDTLAPLVTPQTETYAALKTSIIARIP